MKKKELTREQAEAAKEKAARFVEDVLEDDEHADEIRSEDLDEWAARKRVTITPNPNSRRSTSMATTKELKERIEELEAENEELQERLDSIADIVSPDEEEEDEDEEDQD